MGVHPHKGRERVTHSEAFWADPNHGHLTRCLATQRDGTRCRAEAIAGGNVCTLHGGEAGQVRRKAAERVVRSAEVAVDRIIDFINDADIPAGIRLKAAQVIADRAGLAATQMHRIVTDQSDPMEQLFRELLADSDALEDSTDLIIEGSIVEEEPQPALPAPLIEEEPKVSISSAPPAWLNRAMRDRRS